jgi:hypothetical protein
MTRAEELRIARAHVEQQIAERREREEGQERARLQKRRDDLLAGKTCRAYGECNCDACLNAILDMSNKPVFTHTR